MIKFKYYYLVLVIILSGHTLRGQEANEKALFEFANQANEYIEGFSRNIGGNAYSYHSIRSDVSKSIITRCTDGKMVIEWETQTIPTNIPNEGVGFLWIASMDLTDSPLHFDVFINDQKRFTIPTSMTKKWTLDHQEGGSLSFITVAGDQHGDAHGYMSLWAPKAWLTKGKAQRIKIVGCAADDNTWLMVYQATDALDFLKKSMEYNNWAKILLQKEAEKYTAKIEMPSRQAGTKLKINTNNNHKEVKLIQSGNQATAEIKLSAEAIGKPFGLIDNQGELLYVSKLGKPGKEMKLLAKAILKTETQQLDHDGYLINTQRNYQPKTVSSMLELANSKLADGKIYLMNSSHQDIAWMDSPEKCIIERDTMLLVPLFEKAQLNPHYRFDVEDALMIKEYIERHPEQRGVVQQLLSDGRISCGSTYIQPYEEMYAGEALARQFYFGAKWLKDEFGYEANTYWNVDVPGRTLQMPQLMKKAGTKYMMISRFKRGMYNWYSPDGSYVTTFSPGHYADAFTPLHKNFNEAAQYLATSSLDWEQYYSSKKKDAVIPLLSDWDMSPAKDYSHHINKWESIKELQNDNGEYVPVSLPKFEIASTPEFFDAWTGVVNDLPSINGERPAVWLYIHGPSHQKALKASRMGDILLPMAEKFATMNALSEGSFKDYPQDIINSAWEDKIYPDHGWGGKNGQITDDLFLRKYQGALHKAEKVIHKELNDLASNIKVSRKKGLPIVVFNSLNWTRDDIATFNINFEPQEAKSVIIKDASGKVLPSQLTNIKQYDDGSIKSAKAYFVAPEVPSLGYKTFYLSSSNQESTNLGMKITKSFENKFFKATFDNGGLSNLYDKELKKEIFNTQKFNAGEVFTMHSEGNGAGEFADIQQPDMRGFDRTGNYTTKWELVEAGPVFSAFKIRQPIKHAVVEQTIIFYNDLKKVDFKTELLNWEGILYREFRMALPLNMNDGEITYEVPYGTVTVGKDEMEGDAGERYTAICKEMHPRGIENWIGANGEGFGVTMSSSVVAADWIDPTDNPMQQTMLQPILLASRKSCHWEGNEYLQTGNHSFEFSLTSHQSGWQNGQKHGKGANEKLQVVVGRKSFANPALPEEKSFFKVKDPNIVISTVKKAEDDDQVVIRLFDIEGKNTQTTIHTANPIKEASLTNLIEEPIKKLSTTKKTVNLTVGHHAIETIKLK
ncbi:alpha-mannosidase [Puteibacter caeruleilacunae]|nr:alpha-mannosidase [Puteibacter caeruleilacunae]